MRALLAALWLWPSVALGQPFPPFIGMNQVIVTLVVPCSAAPGTVVGQLGVIYGSVDVWKMLSTNSDFSVSPSGVVTVKSLPAGHCNTPQPFTVTGQ